MGVERKSWRNGGVKQPGGKCGFGTLNTWCFDILTLL